MSLSACVARATCGLKELPRIAPQRDVVGRTRNRRSVIGHLAAKIPERGCRQVMLMSSLPPLLGARAEKDADHDHRQLDDQASETTSMLRGPFFVCHRDYLPS